MGNIDVCYSVIAGHPLMERSDCAHADLDLSTRSKATVKGVGYSGMHFDFTMVRTGTRQLQITGVIEDAQVDLQLGTRKNVYVGSYTDKDQNITVTHSDELGVTFTLDQAGTQHFQGTVPWLTAFATESFDLQGCEGKLVFVRIVTDENNGKPTVERKALTGCK